MHALIIEDEFLIAALIEDALSELGFTSFDWAPSQDIAVEKARARKPDLVTADVMLNPGNGVEAVVRIKAERDVPVVFITSDPGKVAPFLPRAVIIEKPFSKVFLQRTCAALIHP